MKPLEFIINILKPLSSKPFLYFLAILLLFAAVVRVTIIYLETPEKKKPIKIEKIKEPKSISYEILTE